jgi:hypothetical protein
MLLRVTFYLVAYSAEETASASLLRRSSGYEGCTKAGRSPQTKQKVCLWTHC